MFNLIQLFLKLGGFFVFAILEIACFTMIIKYNQTQKDIYLNTVNRGTGLFHEFLSNTDHYFSLDDENFRLARENARLLDKLYSRGIDTSGVKDPTYPDSLATKYTFLEAKVVKNSISKHHNYLVLNVGRKDGVLPHTGVISSDGVVGIIRKVSHSYAVAMSVLHRQTRISARIRSTNFFGSFVWKDRDRRLFHLDDIPKHAQVSIGDTIETSGYSAIFPEGIMLGVVESAEIEKSSNYYTIGVRSKLDMSNIQYVYVVKNLLKKEQENLEQAVLEEDE